MNWYNYVACFFSGIFLTNVVPHFAKGICGDRFPTPFAKPPGQGLSSPTTNVLWALANLVVGCELFRIGNVASGADFTLIVFFAAVAILSVLMSARFAHKDVG
ncbi:MAG: hypothetical protein WA823_08745 [Candidatus Acidiferrales bacterium]